MRAHRLLVLVVILLVAPRCATVKRTRGTDSVHGQARWSQADDVSHGCDGEVLDSEAHEQVGGTVVVERHSQEGFSAGFVAAAGRGVVVDSVDRATLGRGAGYLIGSVGGWIGRDFKYFGFDLGGHIVFSGRAGFMPLPDVTLRLGAIDHLWGELQVGPREGVFDGEIAGLHLAYASESFSGWIGLGGFARAMVLSDAELSLGANERGLDLGFALDVAIPFNDTWAIGLGGVLSEAPSVWLGVRYSHPHRPEPADVHGP